MIYSKFFYIYEGGYNLVVNILWNIWFISLSKPPIPNSSKLGIFLIIVGLGLLVIWILKLGILDINSISISFDKKPYFSKYASFPLESFD